MGSFPPTPVCASTVGRRINVRSVFFPEQRHGLSVFRIPRSLTIQQRRPYHWKVASRLSSSGGEKIHQITSLVTDVESRHPQPSEIRAKIDPRKTKFISNSRDLNRGGGGGIRTRDTVSRIHTFQACAFSRSATPPVRVADAKSAHITAAGCKRKSARSGQTSEPLRRCARLLGIERVSGFRPRSKGPIYRAQ